MKDKFQSKAVPRGTRTIWRYLGALFILFTFAIGNVWAEDFTITSITNGSNLSPGNLVKVTYSGDLTTSSGLIKAGKNKSGAFTITTSAPDMYLKSATFHDDNISSNNKKATLTVASGGSLSGPSNGTYTFTASDNTTTATINAAAGSGGEMKLSALTVVVTNGSVNNMVTLATFSFSTPTISASSITCKGNAVTAPITLTSSTGWGASSNKISAPNSNSKYITVEAVEGKHLKYISFYDDANARLALTEKSPAVGTVVGASWTASDDETKSVTFYQNVGTSLTVAKVYVITEDDPAATTHALTWNFDSGSCSATEGTDYTAGGQVAEGATITYPAASTMSKDGKDFAGWSTSATTMPTTDLTITAQWVDHVAKYTVKYMDGSTVLDTEEVTVGQYPAGLASDPTKDCYTFAGWDPALSGVSGSDGKVINVSATWTPIYSSSATLISDAVVSGKPNVNTVFAASNIVSSITFSSSNYEFTSNETKPGYYGYKDKQSGDYMKILVKQGKSAQVLFGNLGDDPTITVNGVAKSLDASRATGENAENTFTYTASAEDALVSITMGSGTNTLKKVDIVQLYTATRVDGKSDAEGTDANVLETTLPTPTAISGWTFTGWVADADVKAGEDTKTAGTVLAAGTYTLLANTIFTAQWMEVTGTYDITYVSAHGTAPDSENAASVVLAELEAEGWAHKGWTANVNVTVDAATVEAGTLIANGKTVILASNVTFTAVWKQIFEVEFDTNDGSEVAKQYIEDGEHPTAVANPTKDNYVFVGWFNNSDLAPEHAVADITALTISDNTTLYAKWALDIQISEIVFSNGFKAWINGSAITVFYMEGESAPTITSYAGKNLKAEGGVVISGDKIIATAKDDSELEFDLTMTAVAPLDAAGAHTFDGTEGYVKTRHAWTSDRKWKLSKDASDGRVARGECSMYFFVGPAESITFDWGAQKGENDVAVYVNGTFVKNIGKNNNTAIELSKDNNMVAFYTLQTSGDIWVNGMTIAPWVSTTAVVLREGETAISEKEIWESTSFTLTAIVTPDNASNKTITWTSSDDDIATVVNGVVTGVAASATPVTITASTVDGVSATCVVTVTEAPSPCETPTITTQPATQAYCAGSEPTLTVEVNAVSDGGTLHYAWFKEAGETDVAVGSDQDSYTIASAGTYYVIVTNHVDGKLDASVTSSNAVVTLNTPASITTQPTNKSEIVSGSSVTLSLVATNATSYQWYSCDDAEKHGAAAISGAEDANYVFTCNANGFYYCVVGNACGEDLISDVVSVKLEPEGCNTFESKPDAPYNYEQTGEWTFYNVDSNGADKSTYNVFGDGKNFDNGDVVVANTRRFALKFEKDVESVTLYGVGGNDKSFTKVSVSDEMVKNTYTELTATATKVDVADKQHVFTIEDVIIPAGKYAWFEFSGSLNFFKICYTTALAMPKLPATLANQELCADAPYKTFDATITNAADCEEGTVSYEWYKTTDTENPVATTASYTPYAEGTYYVVVKHAAAGHATRVAQSANLTVAHFDALTLVSNSGDVFQRMGTAATLSVVATGKNVAYVWYTCSNAAGDDAVAIDPAETEASLAIASVAEGVQYYKVVISHDCDVTTLSHVFKVEGWDQLEQVDVTGNMKWDFSKANDGSAAGSNLCTNAIFANVAGIVNNDDFESDNLMVTANKFSNGKLQGSMIKFYTTVPGAVIVKCSNTGSNKPERYLMVNGVETELHSTNQTVQTYAEYVPAGDVVLTVGGDGNMFNFTSVEFKVDKEASLARTDSWLAPGEMGTICIPQGAVAVGADIYELVGSEPVYGKIVFETVKHMKPGKPYMFISKGNRIDLILTDEDEASEPDNSGAMKGTFEQLYLNELENVYYFAQHALWSCVDLTQLNVPANRAYVKLDEVEPIASPTPAPGRVRMSLGVNGAPAVTTGIENGGLMNGENGVQKVLINGQIFILRGEKMFDATGRLVK